MAAERPSPETALPAVLAEQSARLRKLFIIADSDMPQAVSAAVQVKASNSSAWRRAVPRLPFELLALPFVA
eukprot:362200-Chlamydomonas_euryale.AAC.16